MYKLIDGKQISNSILDELKEKAKTYSENGKTITLVDILVGNDEASKIYIENKKKKFEYVGIKFESVVLSEDIKEEELIGIVKKYNADEKCNGILIEMPLPKHIDANKVINVIDNKKDVDGFSTKNLGILMQNNKGFFPCTAEGIVELLKRANIELAGKHCVVVGRSNVVGKPVALLMLNENATVTICHSKTNNLQSICKTADILIVAIGKPKLIDESYVKEGAVVIDAGMHRIIINDDKEICGDVDFERVSPHTSYITPVPGGVGPMTVTILIKHCIETLQNE